MDIARSGRGNGMGRLLHPGMIDIAAILAAPLPWDDRAAVQHITWMLRVGAAWWNCFASLAGGPEMGAAASVKPCQAQAWLTEPGL
jgi:hypothetical protein